MNKELSPYASVIVPVYKTPLDYFKQCLNSLHNQTLQEAEFIIVFDGKNAELHSFCEEYKKRDKRFKIYVQPHEGVSATRNYGIMQANGMYIAFVDADDSLYSNDILASTIQYIEEELSDILLFNWSQNKLSKKNLWEEDKKELSNEEREFCLKQFICIQNESFNGAPWAKLFKRTFLLKNNIFFSEKCVIGQDRVFNYKAFSLTKKISYHNLCFYNYNVNEYSTTQRFRPGYLSTILNYIEELSILSNGKYPYLIGKEALLHFYKSWERDYMNFQNKKKFFYRMKELTNIVKSDRFQTLIKKTDTTNYSVLVKIESKLLQHKISIWIYPHGLKRLISLGFRNKIPSLSCHKNLSP